MKAGQFIAILCVIGLYVLIAIGASRLFFK